MHTFPFVIEAYFMMKSTELSLVAKTIRYYQLNYIQQQVMDKNMRERVFTTKNIFEELVALKTLHYCMNTLIKCNFQIKVFRDKIICQLLLLLTHFVLNCRLM
jgi:hypothetical protein